MRKDDRESVARAKRVAKLAQRAVDVLGSASAAYHWLTTSCDALRGKSPRDIHYDVKGASRVATALRRRALRRRKVRSAGLGAFEDEAALTVWLWKKNRALGNRLPAMLLDSDRGATHVMSVMSRTRRKTESERSVGKPEIELLDLQSLTKSYGLSTLQIAKMVGGTPTGLRRAPTSPKMRHEFLRLTSLLLNIRRMLGDNMDAVKVWLNAPHLPR